MKWTLVLKYKVPLHSVCRHVQNTGMEHRVLGVSRERQMFTSNISGKETLWNVFGQYLKCLHPIVVENVYVQYQQKRDSLKCFHLISAENVYVQYQQKGEPLKSEHSATCRHITKYSRASKTVDQRFQTKIRFWGRRRFLVKLVLRIKIVSWPKN